MNRNRINFWLDLVSLLVMLALLQTGFMMKFLLPPGSGHGPDGGPGLTILGWNRHGWGNLHWWLAVGLVGLMVAHVALHWRWVMRTATAFVARREAQDADSSRRGSLIPSGVLFLVLLVGLSGGALFWAQRSIRGECIPHDEHLETRASLETQTAESFPHGDRRICSRLTLSEIERNTGVSASVMIERLGLPKNTPTDVKLGRLAEDHGFSVPQVRDIINEEAGQ